MLNKIDKLLNIQDKDQILLRLTREAQQIPLRKNEMLKRLELHQKNLEDSKNEYQLTQARVAEYENEVESKKALILKYKKQQYEVKDNEAYRALESEIRDTQRRITEIEDNELLFMEKLEERKTLMEETQGKLKTEENLVAQDQEMLEKRATEISNQIETLKLERDTLAKEVEPDWLSRYEHIFKNKKDVAIVNAAGGTCKGCYMQLQPQLVHNAKRADAMTACSYCGRLLYFKV